MEMPEIQANLLQNTVLFDILSNVSKTAWLEQCEF